MSKPNRVDVGTVIGGAERFDGATAEVRNPGRIDEVVGSYRVGTAADVDAAVAIAALAQPEWERLDVAARSDVLGLIADAIQSRADTLATCLSLEVGTPLAQARGEIGAAVGAFRNAADHAAAVLAPLDTKSPAGGWVRVGRRAYGVVGCIVPWNAPIALAAQKLAPALVTGNAVVLKPSPLAPLTVTEMAKVIGEHLPAGILNVINGGADVGTALIENPLVRKISFTGGGETARAIMRGAAQSLTKVHFELGGNDPAILLDDVDLDLAAERIAATAFRRAGQICYAVKRVYVPETLMAAFVERLIANVDALVVGDGLDDRTTMGPVNNAAQLETITRLTEGARAAGRDVRVLGIPLDPEGWHGGYFLRPTLVVDAQQDDELVLTEQFGPLLPIVSYSSEEQALAYANGTEYGLASSVWSTNPERALAIAGRIQAGLTFINNHVLSPMGSKVIPFGGVKQSGMGWENSPVGLEEYLEFHSIDVHPTPDTERGRQ